MQAFFGLKVTGKVNTDTLNLMKQPRCGVPDVAQYVLTDGSQWDHTHLTYRIENYTPDLPRAEVDSAIEKAFQLWSNASPLTFTKAFEGQADIMISLVWGDHRDNSPFSGFRNHFPHAFPPRDIGGDVHFDKEKHVPMISEIYIYFGDVLLSQKDIDAPRHSMSSKYWAFNGEQMLQGYPRDIHYSLGFPQRVKKINAAVHEDDTRKTYFFVANEYWRCDENTWSMDTGFPKGIAHGFPRIGKKVDALFQEGDFSISFMEKGNTNFILKRNKF
ncbi:Interstitial collagenase [Vulpes lagopus]